MPSRQTSRRILGLASAGPGRRSGSLRRVIVAVFALIILIGGGLAYALSRVDLQQSLGGVVAGQLDSRASNDGRAIHFTIRPGESTSAIASRLESAGLIDSASNFRLLSRMRGADGQLKAGEYELRANMTSGEILDALRANSGGTSFTVPEGWRAAEIADALDKRGLAKRDDFLTAARASDYSNDFLANRPEGASLEGYLFPDTQQFLPGTSARAIVQAMLDDFGRRFTPEMRSQAASRGLTINQVVILASIIERETVVPEERPLVAGVINNRLQKNMRLQTDATVQFAILGPDPAPQLSGYWKRGLTVLDLQFDSPYNTYRIAGLPIGPIANPGLASLKAALAPTPSDYLYFVAKPDGSHAFARTLKEHNDNVAKYQ